RRVERRIALQAPGDVRIRDVALAVNTDRQQLRGVITGRKKHQAMPENGPRNERVTIVSDLPDFLPGLGIVGHHTAGAGQHHLFAAVDLDGERSAKGEALDMVKRARRFPIHLAVRYVQRDDERIALAIATEYQQVIDERRAAPVAVNRRILE